MLTWTGMDEEYIKMKGKTSFWNVLKCLSQRIPRKLFATSNRIFRQYMIYAPIIYMRQITISVVNVLSLIFLTLQNKHEVIICKTTLMLSLRMNKILVFCASHTSLWISTTYDLTGIVPLHKIQQRTSLMSHNVTEMCTRVQISFTKWCIVVYLMHCWVVRRIYCNSSLHNHSVVMDNSTSVAIRHKNSLSGYRSVPARTPLLPE